MKKFLQKIVKSKKERGFTILETLVAIFILVLSVTGPMVFAQSGLRTAFLARDQITAFFLAQDAIETIKNIRDDNALEGENWLEGIFVCSEAISEDCLITIDTTQAVPVVEECESGVCTNLKNDEDGRFGYTFGGGGYNDSRFTRNVYLREIVENQEMQIVVEVTWTSNVRVGNSRIVVQENIYNWVPRVDEAPGV